MLPNSLVPCTPQKPIIWMFPKIGVPQNGSKWMVYKAKPENPIKMDDLEVALFLETPMC